MSNLLNSHQLTLSQTKVIPEILIISFIMVYNHSNNSKETIPLQLNYTLLFRYIARLEPTFMNDLKAFLIPLSF